VTFRARTPDEAWGQGTAAVICYDAGAASHAFSWLVSDPSRKAVIYAEGPAARVASAHRLRVARSLERALASADWALVGTGWQSDLERRAMRLCAMSGIPCVAIVDHWVNYPDRFRGVEVHERPQLVVVTDAAAEELARQQLPWTMVTRWPNDQATAFVRAVHDLRERRGLGLPYLLWIQEPIREADGRVWDPLADSRLGPQLWELTASAMETRSLDRVIVRLHPSQHATDYGLQRVNVEIRSASESALADDVSGAGLCLGIDSYALYLSALSGLETISVAALLQLPLSLPRGVVRIAQ